MSVHSTHCCPIHGCKYGEEQQYVCTIVLGFEKPVYPKNNGCEMCEDEKETPVTNRLSHMSTQKLFELRGAVENAITSPDRYCLSGECKSTNWGGKDRLHLRTRSECPPPNMEQLETWAREIDEALEEPQRGKPVFKTEEEKMTEVTVKPTLTDAQFSLLSEISTYARRIKRHAENYGQDLEYLQRAVERGKVPPSVHAEMPNVNLVNEFIFALTRLADDFGIPDELVTLALQTKTAEIAVRITRGK
ncbi:hypothetical protein SEA_SIXAMA_46 [Gordonia phage Sixama]|uniref:Uncharacterized protein n=1 Tax=Gordonia phage Sixama TaxID=2653271 RepID=A0A5Q2F6Z7_9CAUD|nr:hypothetical protein PP302_gp046 [Gordonia phage Sixama]QGF20225.1 hypothetical protein SEA_SIXAMA_46 [Gordonia phage Sixama]